MTGSGGGASGPEPRGLSPSDHGLQAERTMLSWRRTAMSVVVGSLVGLKLLPVHLGVLGYVASVLGLLWSLDLALGARHRYRDADRALRADLNRERADLTHDQVEPVRPRDKGRSRSAQVGLLAARTALIAGLVGLGALVCVIVMEVA